MMEQKTSLVVTTVTQAFSPSTRRHGEVAESPLSHRQQEVSQLSEA